VYQLKLTSRAQREFEKLPARELERIAGALQKLGDNPRPPGTRKLRGQIHRIRVGDWRIIYAILDRESIILIG
jgi:mRNA interferase RelE/StbE